MLNNNPYFPRVPLVALESIHTQRPYSLQAGLMLKGFEMFVRPAWIEKKHIVISQVFL